MCVSKWNSIITVLLLLFTRISAFQSGRVLRNGKLQLSSTTENSQNDILEDLICSNELQNVFLLLLKNPTIYPSPEQSTILLNNLNVLAKISSGNDVSKFYQRLVKAGKTIPSFGSMVLDGPLSELSLPKFEVLMTVDPTFLQTATELKESAYSSLLIPNELGVMASATRSSLEIRVKLQVKDILLPLFTTTKIVAAVSLLKTLFLHAILPVTLLYQIALLYGFIDLGYQLSVTGNSHDALANVALTFGIAAGQSFYSFIIKECSMVVV